jgi:hypothetical protein
MPAALAFVFPFGIKQYFIDVRHDPNAPSGKLGEPSMLVKLNERGVRAYMASGGAASRRHVDWQSRTGRVVKYSRDRSHAYVIWNGNHTSDRVSVDLIEPCSFAPDITDSPVGH